MLSANVENRKSKGEYASEPVEGGVTIYKGAMLVAELTGSHEGCVKPGTDVANVSFVGIAYEEKDNSTGADKAVSVRVEEEGTYDFKFVGDYTKAIGKIVYLHDDETVSVTTSNSIKVGKVVQLPDSGTDHVRVKVAITDEDSIS